MKSKKFVQLEHMADIKYNIFGKSLKDIFENTALAFSKYISPCKSIKSLKNIDISLSADNKETLLYKFIDELIYVLDAKNFAVSKAEVYIDQKNNSLKAKMYGDSTKKYDLNHVKAATYAEMSIKNNGNVWQAIIVLDV